MMHSEKKRKAYTVCTPPVKVTGKFTMADALTTVLQDMLVRRARMQGFDTVCVPSSHDGGLETQSVVERTLQVEEPDGVFSPADYRRVAKSFRVGRENDVIDQQEVLGASLSWQLYRHTFDEHYSYRMVSQINDKKIDEVC